MEKYILEELDNIKSLIKASNLTKLTNLNVRQASIYLDLKESYIYKLVSKNQLPYSKPNGKKIYFSRVDLDNWMQKNKCRSIDQIQSSVNNKY